MCAPSMPFASPPSTRLSRVAPQEACLATSTSGMPFLAKNSLFLCDKERRGIRKGDEAKHRFRHFRPIGERNRHPERELRIDCAEQRGGSCACLEKCTAADTAVTAAPLFDRHCRRHPYVRVFPAVTRTYPFVRVQRLLRAKQKAAVLKRGGAHPKTAAFPDGPSLDRSAGDRRRPLPCSIQVSCQLALRTKTHFETMSYGARRLVRHAAQCRLAAPQPRRLRNICAMQN